LGSITFKGTRLLETDNLAVGHGKYPGQQLFSQLIGPEAIPTNFKARAYIRLSIAKRKKCTIDGDLVFQFADLALAEQEDLPSAISSRVDLILDNLPEA
jgi:hypothetical protein